MEYLVTPESKRTCKDVDSEAVNICVLPKSYDNRPNIKLLLVCTWGLLNLLACKIMKTVTTSINIHAIHVNV